jgi:hypothetical protein
MTQADQGDVQRDPGEERLGAVDGVEHPAELGVDVLGAELLAQDARGRGRPP